MPTAARNRCGNRQSTATALNAPMDAPVEISGGCSPPQSAWTAGTTSDATQSWNWFSSHIR